MALNPIRALIVHPDESILDRFKCCVADTVPAASIRCLKNMPAELSDHQPFDLVIGHEESRMTDGTTFFDFLSIYPPTFDVILISDSGSIPRAVAALRFGAQDYLLKDADEDLVRASVANAIKQSLNPVAGTRNNADKEKTRSIITAAQAMKNLMATADRVADAVATVLIQGESGTGKELLARYIHQRSRRNRSPFFAMNCAALPEHLAESELFGYEKGAFTGAAQKRAGKFEQAHMSTLLLDEISEMPLALQVKLLRVLQEKEVDHIGGKTPISVDTRIIATTNRNLAKMVKDGDFREDLFYRLRVIPLTIPPLRERPEDIELLANHFLTKHRPLQLKQPPTLSAEAISILSKWPWPGNVRELENAIERAVLISDAAEIGPEALLLDQDLAASDASRSQNLVGSTVRDVERRLIGDTLDHVNQNRTHAAKMLGISIRTLRNKLKEYRSSQSDGEKIAAGH